MASLLSRSTLFRLTTLLLVGASAVGCGRSALKSSPKDCPANLLRSDGHCGFDGGTDLGDGGNPDGFDGGRPDGFDGGNPDIGDGGDLCGDKRNCKLPQCVGDPRCIVLGTEICNNGIDDDDDKLIDCKDPDCASFPGCKVVCDPLKPDCTLPDCANLPACRNLKCMPTVDFGTLATRGASVTRTVNTVGTVDVTTTPCAPGGAGMVVASFTTTAVTDVTLSFTQAAGKDHVFGVFRAGVNQTCGQNPVGCYDPKSATMGKNTFAQLLAGEYYVITQPFSPVGQGSVTVTLTTPNMTEICNNGIDDNGNGLIDCADPDCAAATNCVTQVCNPDFNVGALVVNGPAKSASFDTGASSNSSLNLNCQGATGGKDVAVRFTLKETAGIELDWSQNGDHVFGLFRTPPLGEKCDFEQLGCFDPSGSGQGRVAWGDFPPGDYLIITKALKPGDEGQVDVNIRAYRNRQVELCHNGIDDDGNGLIDCADPACVGVSGCSAPYCMPDRQLGNLGVGSSANVTLDVLNNGTLGYNASCSRGGAKGMVVQFTIPSSGMSGGVGVGFDCTQTGDQVLTLDAAGGPREACDVKELVCADPKTLPFGCGYEVPNLQPGTYNVIVAGFRAGSEGSVDLTLSVVDDRQLEICNNGKDDDFDGFTDCADRKCATSQFCANSVCKPDATIDPMPLTGTNVFKLLQTSMNGTKGAVPCATTPGGDAAVVQIRLTANADLNLTYNQIGKHDFQLYTRAGAQLACDAGSATGTCTKSVANTTGTTSWTNLPLGTYYLVIEADSPADAGSVNIALSGLPH